MYELSRVRLYSIGPAGARYADTVLDLRGVGAAVPTPAPVQSEFFADEPVGPPRRPAPAGVLFLENGGGKSVLLKLIFSVMLPGHRNTLGGASSGVLRKFLLADDCGHVALEWQHTLTGELVVVGKASEWRGRQVSGDPRKFAEAWYSFRPGPGLSLDSLPVAEAQSVRPPAEGSSGARGRRRTMKGFRDALTEAGRFYPHLEVYWEEIHDRWNEHLGELGLDPELFRYQREMNSDEGEAAGLFAVKKDSDFTDLLLRAVTDTRDTDGLADLVGGFGSKLGRRAELTAERDFTAGSVDLLGRIVEAAEVRARTREIHTASERRARALVRRLAARAGEERARTGDLAGRVTAAAHTVTGAQDARLHSSLIASEIAYRHASLALAAAEKRAAAQRRELTDARTLHLAWQAAEAVLRHRAAADRSARVAVAIREAERDAAPALAARATAAADLVRALHAAAEDAESLANEEEARSATLQEAGEAAHRDATSAATGAQRARSESEHLRQRLGEVEQETAEAVRAGWLDDTAPDADPARAALAASDAEKSAAAADETARDAARAAAERAREAAAAEARGDLAAARAEDAARAAERAYEAERRAAESIASDRRLTELLSLPDGAAAVLDRAGSAERAGVPGPRTGEGPGATPPGGRPAAPRPAVAGALCAEDFDRHADDLRDLLDQGVAAGERRLFDLRTGAADDSRILGALGDGGLLPPGPDVLATVEYLGEHGIPALPGWRYLAQAVDPADHAAVLAARPELVDGVVITDPAAHARARATLADAALLPRSTVAVGTAAALLAPVPRTQDGDDDVFLVPPNPAMHDEHAADEERRALRTRAAARDGEIKEVAARLAGDRALAARIGSWRADCPPGTLAELAAAAGTARAAARTAAAELTEARAARAESEQSAAEMAAVGEERQEALQRARRAADALKGLAFRLRERPAWQARLRELADDATEAQARASGCLDLARAADEDRRAAQRAADDARRTARTLRAERAEIAGAPERLPEQPAGTPASRWPPCARPTAPPPRCTRRSASAPTCAQNRPVPRATRARPSPNSTGSATRSAAGRASSSNRPTAPTARPGRPPRPAPNRWCRCWSHARPPRASSSAGCAATPNASPRPRATPTPRCPRTRSPPTRRRPRRCCAPPPGNWPCVPTRWRPRVPRTMNCCAPTGPPRTRRVASTRPPRSCATCCAARPRRTTTARRAAPATSRPSSPSRTQATSKRPVATRRRHAGRCAAAPRTCRRQTSACGRRATSSSGTPTPPATSRCARPHASRSGNCPRRRCRNTRGGGPRRSPPPARPHGRTGPVGAQPRLHRGPAAGSRGVRDDDAPLGAAAVPAARGPRGVVRAGVPAYPLRGTGPYDAGGAPRRGRRRGDPRGPQEELRPAPGRHVPAAARGGGGAAAEGCRGGDPEAGRGPARGAGARGADGRRVLRRAAADRGDRPVLHDGGPAQQRPGPRQAPARGHAVPGQPHRPGQRHVPAGAAARGIRRARRPTALHDRPVRHHGTGGVPAGDPVAQRRGPAGGLKYIRVEEHLRPGLPVPDPDGDQVHGEITATRVFRRTPAHGPGARTGEGRSGRSGARQAGPEQARAAGTGTVPAQEAAPSDRQDV